MTKVKLALAALLLAVSGGVAASAQAAVEPIAGDCIYAEYRDTQGCFGATTRLCQGPADCPR